MKKLQTDVLVIGSGATATFAAAICHLRGRRTTLLAPTSTGLLGSIKSYYPDLDFKNTLVPIYPPVPPTDLSETFSSVGLPLSVLSPINDQPDILVRDHKFVPDHQSRSSIKPTLATPGSFAEYASLRDDRTLVLANKQYGADLVGTLPLRLLQEKVERAYTPGAGSNFERLGYIDGRSRYAIAVESLLPLLSVRNGRISELDASKRSVTLVSNERISYYRAIFTDKFTHLARLLGLEIYQPIAASAHFCICARRGGAPNHIVYDFRSDSPLFRMVATDNTVLVAQLAQPQPDDHQGPSPSSCHGSLRDRIRSAASSLLDVWPIDVVSDVITFPGAYPLEPLDASYEAALEARCRGAGIVRFGRFAQWRYVDLHELDWTLVT
jgi:hypothetical protein